MLHPTKIPDCAPELECLLSFQDRLLEFACDHEDFKKEEFIAEFGQEIFNWLNQQKIRNLLLDPLKNFMGPAILEKDKRLVLETFRHDNSFYLFIEDSNFKFELVVYPKSPMLIQTVKTFLKGFYLQLKERGFHPLICGHGANGFTDKNWWAGYRSANPGMNTCSVCDASLSAGAGTIEHFFPKSQYPSLSVHPSNLIPLCTNCNTKIKGEKDPLANNSIQEIFLPYYRDVRSETTLCFSDDGQGGCIVKLQPATSDPTTKKRIDNFEALFEISKLWSLSLEDAKTTAFIYVQNYLDAKRDSGIEIDPMKLQNYIDIICIRMERNWGKSSYEYLATEWLRWAKNNKQALIIQSVQI